MIENRLQRRQIDSLRSQNKRLEDKVIILQSQLNYMKKIFVASKYLQMLFPCA